MPKRWWEPKEYQLKSGRWVPQVHLLEIVPGGLDVTRLLAPKGRTFASQAHAKAYSIAMAKKWLNARGEE